LIRSWSSSDAITRKNFACLVCISASPGLRTSIGAKPFRYRKSFMGVKRATSSGPPVVRTTRQRVEEYYK